MKKNSTLWDLVFYVAIPLVIWHMRDKIGLSDYMAMVISAGIGIVYGLYMFNKQKKLNVFGTFILTDLIITMLITVFSGSAMNLLWNNVYYTMYSQVYILYPYLLKNRSCFIWRLIYLRLIQNAGRVCCQFSIRRK